MADCRHNPQILCIVNSHANKTSIKRLYHAIKTMPSKWKAETHLTQSAEQAKLILRQIDNKRISHIVICGGDGTVHAALPELRQLQIPLYVWPGGTANDLATYLGHDSNPDNLIWSIGNTTTENLDLVAINGILMATSAGIGLGPMTIQTHRMLRSSFLRRAIGIFRSEIYSIISFLQIILSKSKPLALDLKSKDRTIHVLGSNLFFANIPTLARKLRIDKDASPKRGVVRVTSVPALKKIGLIKTFLSLRQQTTEPQIIQHESSNPLVVEVQDKDTVDLFIDGEVYTIANSFEVANLRGSLKTLVRAH